MTAEPESTLCPDWPRDAEGHALPLEGDRTRVRAILDAQARYEAVQALGGEAAARRWAGHALASDDPEYRQAVLEAKMSMRIRGNPKDQLERLERPVW